MNPKMKTLMFGNDMECRAAAEVLKASKSGTEQFFEYSSVDDLEEMEKALVDFGPTLLVVLADGARGMECVYRASERFPDLPVFWFSDDRNFGVQSHRLNCAYFSTKPVTTEKIASAIRRCNHIGIQYMINEVRRE